MSWVDWGFATERDPGKHSFSLRRKDIVETQVGSTTGFLAETEEEYSRALAYIVCMNPNDRDAIRVAARYDD